MTRKRKRNRERLDAPPRTTALPPASLATEASAPRAAGWRVWVAAALIIAAGVAAYANSFRGVFQFDDIRVLNTACIHQLWPPQKSMFAPESISRPLVGLSLAVNYAIGGLEPWGYHAVNLAVHILAALVLFGLVRRTLVSPLLRERIGGAATALALLMTLLWLLHPLQTESVTYVIQRAEAMMGLFYLLTLYCAARAFAAPPSPFPLPKGERVGVRGRGWQIAAVLACAMGMACKQVMVTAPLLVLLYDRTFAAGSFTTALQRRWRFYAALAATWLILAASLAFVPSGAFGMADLTWWPYACSQPGVILHYLRLAFWPGQLCLDYDWPRAGSVGEIVLPGLPLLLLLGATIWALWRAPAWGFLGAWFFLILAPTSSVMPIQDLAFEHRMYLSLAALAAAVSCAVFLAGRKLLEQRNWRWAAVGLAVLVLGGLTWRTIQRNRDYASELGMWTQAVEERPNNARANNNLGHILSKSGRLEEAIAHFRKAIEIKPNYADAYFNLGLAYALGDANRQEEAIAQYRKAIEIRPDHAGAHNNLANALGKAGRPEEAIAHYRKAIGIEPGLLQAHYNLGVEMAKAGQPDEAIAHYRKAIEIKPDYLDAYLNLGYALLKAGRLEEAITNYRRAIEIEPGRADTYHSLGCALGKAGRLEEALARYRKAIEIKPDYAEAHDDLGLELVKAGRLGEGLEHYRKAIEIKPDYADAHFNLGYALGKAGRPEEAIAEYCKAIEIKPDHADAHNNLGNALLKAGRREDAIAHYRKAVETKPDCADAQYNLGNALGQAGRLEEAVAHCRKAIEIAPDYTDAYNNLGNVLYGLGRLEEAVAAYTKAIQLKPDYASAHANLAEVLGKLGRSEESATHAREAARLRAAVEAKK